MISINNIKKIVHKLHLDDLVRSMNECRKDNTGGFLIPTSAKVSDSEYARYRYLPINWSLPPLTKEELPKEFSPHAVKTVDMFRRKTIDLSFECMLYFDYKSGNIVSCNFSDENSPDEVNGVIFKHLLKKMHIASIHNHPNQYLSPPSGKNFEMLGLDFEEFEIISAQKELWILESRNLVLEDVVIEKLRKKFDDALNSSFDEVVKEFDERYLILDNVNELYGDFSVKLFKQ
ncbi:MAG: hypothetical protein VZR10_04525 [Methanobrevibacter sp.]|nr:hypothetical protein [Methanobrevibacter sp.]